MPAIEPPFGSASVAPLSSPERGATAPSDVCLERTPQNTGRIRKGTDIKQLIAADEGIDGTMSPEMAYNFMRRIFCQKQRLDHGQPQT